MIALLSSLCKHEKENGVNTTTAAENPRQFLLPIFLFILFPLTIPTSLYDSLILSQSARVESRFHTSHFESPQFSPCPSLSLCVACR